MTRKSEKIPDALVVLLGERTVGRVERAGNTLEFVYDADWREHGPRIPLSMSMPLSGARYGHDIISIWMWGLLTDNGIVLAHIPRV